MKQKVNSKLLVDYKEYATQKTKNKGWRGWQNKSQEKGSFSKPNPDKNVEQNKEGDDVEKGKYPSPSKSLSGPSVSKSIPNASVGHRAPPSPIFRNPLPAKISDLGFEDKVEKLSQLLADPNELTGLELVLNRSGLKVSTDFVEEVLKNLTNQALRRKGSLSAARGSSSIDKRRSMGVFARMF